MKIKHRRFHRLHDLQRSKKWIPIAVIAVIVIKGAKFLGGARLPKVVGGNDLIFDHFFWSKMKRGGCFAVLRHCLVFQQLILVDYLPISNG